MCCTTIILKAKLPNGVVWPFYSEVVKMRKIVLLYSICFILAGLFPFPGIINNANASGLAFDGRYLWFSDYDKNIHKLDPWASDEKIVQTFTWPIVSGEGSVRWRDLTWDGSYLWAASWGSYYGSPEESRKYKINPNDGSYVFSFDAPFYGHADGMAWDGNDLWIGEENHHIYKVDPSSGMIISSFSVPLSGDGANPRGLAWDGSNIWAGYQGDGTIKKHDINDGSVIASINSPFEWSQQGLTYDGTYLWAAGQKAR